MSLLHDLQEQSPLQQKLHQLLHTLQQKHPQVQRLAVALYDHGSDWVKTFVAVDDQANPLPHYHARLSETTWLLDVANHQTPRVINDFSVLEHSHKRHIEALISAGYRSSYTVPMCVNGHFFGFIFFNAQQIEAFHQPLLSELDMLGHLASLMVYNERASVRTLLAALKSATHLTHARDPETGNHLERMSRYSRLIAGALSLDAEEAETVELSAPLHDIGKIGIPDQILLKPGKLDAPEWALMQRHAVIGHDILKGSASKYVRMGALIALAHHEKYDGSGYPNGLEGDHIPVCARIVAVADVYDALTSVRPYKAAWPSAEAMDYVASQAGKHFDPRMVEAFLRSKDEILKIQSEWREPSPDR